MSETVHLAEKESVAVPQVKSQRYVKVSERNQIALISTCRSRYSKLRSVQCELVGRVRTRPNGGIQPRLSKCSKLPILRILSLLFKKSLLVAKSKLVSHVVGNCPFCRMGELR